MKRIKVLVIVVMHLITVVDSLAQSTLNHTDNDGWEMLFDGTDLKKWKAATSANGLMVTGWKIEGNELFVAPGSSAGDIATNDQYSDFELEFEFSISDSANSGVKYFVRNMTNKKTGAESPIGLEYQIIDDVNFAGIEKNTSTGSVYLLYAPENKKLLTKPQWNRGRIVSNKNYIEHWLNGTRVLAFKTTDAEFRKLIAETKFKDYPDYGVISAGNILLQDHGGGVRFRNIRIKRL